MNQTNCVICDSEAGRTAADGLTSPYSSRPYSLRECAGCGHLRTDPYPAEDELAEIYRDVYRYDAHEMIAAEKRARARRLLAWLEKMCGPLAGKRLLDLGCMFGELVEEAGRRGMRASGVESDVAAADAARSRGLDVRTGTAEELLPGEEGAEFIVLSHVLEHLRAPEMVLSALRRASASESRLVVLVPNRAALLAAVFGRAWAWWQVPVHLNHFDIDRLSSLLVRAGFRPEATRYAAGDSLMFLLSALNAVGLAPKRGERKGFGPAGRVALRSVSALVSAASPALSLVSSDELGILARVDGGPR